MDTLKNKVTLITGAGKESGRLWAQAFAEQNAIVAVNDISPINVEEVLGPILAKGGNAKACIDDSAKKVAVQNIINPVKDDFGRIDILINHAAVEPNIPLLDMDEGDWHRTLDVNLTGAFLMTQIAGSGSIQSKAAFLASMRGLDGFTHQATRELSPYGIQVFALENVQRKIVEMIFALLGLRMEER